MKTILAALAVGLLASGCASIEKVTLAPDAASSLNGKTLALSTRAATPDFSAMTAAKGALGMVGALAAISEGNELVRQHAIPVPSEAIGQALGKQLQGARGMRLLAAPVVVVSNEPEQVAAAAQGAADFILDVRTTAWTFSYHPAALTRYRVNHTAQARLIDTASRKVVAQGSCAYPLPEAANAPGYDQLVADGAALLKQQLAAAGQDCAAVLTRDLLAL